MLRLGGSFVEKGIWWSAVDGKLTDMSGGGKLPGEMGTLYIRRPAGGAFVVIPVVAALYALTFPALGPLAVAIAWAIALVGMAAVAVSGLARSASYTRELAAMGWRPVQAYFAGLKKRGKKK